MRLCKRELKTFLSFMSFGWIFHCGGQPLIFVHREHGYRSAEPFHRPGRPQGKVGARTASPARPLGRVNKTN